MQGDGETYTTSEAASRLFYATGASVIALIKRGQLHGLRIPGYRSRYRVSKSEVEALRARMLKQAAKQRDQAQELQQLLFELN